MPTVSVCDLPAGALLSVYARGRDCYTDCFAIDIGRVAGLPAFVAAFYTTPLFKLKRVILNVALSIPSTDCQAQRLAEAQTDRFSAWVVEK